MKQPEVIEKKPELKLEQKPVSKSWPVASTPIPGTVWCVVWTNDGRCFFYNPSKRQSVWKRPEELKNRADVDQLLPSRPELKTEIKKEKEVQEEPPSKKIKLEAEVKKVKEENNNEAVKLTDLAKEVVSEARIHADQHKSVSSTLVRVKQLKQMPAEKNATSNGVMKKKEQDKKIRLPSLTEILENRQHQKEAAIQVFKEYLAEKVTDSGGSYRAFKSMCVKDCKLRIALSNAEMESLYASHVYEICKRNQESAQSILVTSDGKWDKEQSRKLCSSSTTEKFEGRLREMAVEDVKKCLAESVIDAGESFTAFRHLCHGNYNLTKAMPDAEMRKLYDSFVHELRIKRAIIWLILDEADISNPNLWLTVKNKIKADPNFANFNDSQWKFEKKYAVYKHKKFVKAIEDFHELLRETKCITIQTQERLLQRRASLWNIKSFLMNDVRYAALEGINTQRDQMILDYIYELSWN